MEIKHRTKEYIILEDVPLVGPVTAYSFIGAGILPIIIVFTRYPQHKFLALWGLLIFLVGVFLLFRLKEQTRVILDRSRNTFLVIRKKPLGNSLEKAYDLADIEEIKIETSLEKNGQRIVAQLKDGQCIPFTSQFKGGQENSYPAICRTIKQYLGIYKTP